MMSQQYRYLAHILLLLILTTKTTSSLPSYRLQPTYDITSISNKQKAYFKLMSDTSTPDIKTPPDSPIPSLTRSALLSPSFSFPLPPTRKAKTATLLSVPTSILPPPTTMTTTKQITVGGIVIDVEIGSEQVRISSGAIYLKADRANLSERDKIDLLKLISSKQQQASSRSIRLSENTSRRCAILRDKQNSS
jgi:hypothetical protein